MTRSDRRVKRVELDEMNILGILKTQKAACVRNGRRKPVATPLVLSHAELMGPVDEKTVKQIFGDLFDAPTLDEVVKECKVAILR